MSHLVQILALLHQVLQVVQQVQGKPEYLHLLLPLFVPNASNFIVIRFSFVTTDARPCYVDDPSDGLKSQPWEYITLNLSISRPGFASPL